ncbi:MAG: hypothetical protein KIT85_15130 [Pseudolabrys sp.]|nr:hypothetical protein [Pseudolabrys sp.]
MRPFFFFWILLDDGTDFQPNDGTEMLQAVYLDTNPPNVIIWGTTEDLFDLAKALSASAKQEPVIGDVLTTRPNRLVLSVMDKARGLTLEDSALRWEITPQIALYFASLVQAVAASPKPCHNYLDDESSLGIEVKISLDEYPENWHS